VVFAGHVALESNVTEAVRRTVFTKYPARFARVKSARRCFSLVAFVRSIFLVSLSFAILALVPTSLHTRFVRSDIWIPLSDISSFVCTLHRCLHERVYRRFEPNVVKNVLNRAYLAFANYSHVFVFAHSGTCDVHFVSIILTHACLCLYPIILVGVLFSIAEQ